MSDSDSDSDIPGCESRYPVNKINKLTLKFILQITAYK